jgi:hypothetical protein
MTQTGGLVILYAWAIFAGLLTILACLLLRHEQDPLQDLTRPGTDGNVTADTKPAPGSRDDS